MTVRPTIVLLNMLLSCNKLVSCLKYKPGLQPPPPPSYQTDYRKKLMQLYRTTDVWLLVNGINLDNNEFFLEIKK